MNPKLLPKSGGIYSIKNTLSGKIYIGRTRSFYRRCHQYIYDFNNRSIGHINDHLFRAMSKYGLESFAFGIVEHCDIDIQPERELYWIIALNTTDRRFGYNIRLDVGGAMVVSEETSHKISSNLKTQWASGIRDNHSKKLKESWLYRDRSSQGKLFSKYLTLYEYIVNFNSDNEIIADYKKLCEMGLKSALSSFHRKKSDTIVLKGITIHRRAVSESET